MGIVAIGQAVPRHEDPTLLKGEGSYTGDVSLPNQAYGYVLRSPHAHAKLVSIETKAAKAAAGVIDVFTGADCKTDGIGKLPTVQMPAPNFDFDSHVRPDRYALATDKVHFVGEEVAFVVAETLAQARDAAELIEVDYEPLPAVTNATEAMRDGAPQIWPDNPGNVCFESELGDKAATDAAFEKAKHIIKQRMVVNRSSANSMETRGTNADFDPVSGRCTVYVGVQGVFGMRNTLANAIFDDEIENFRVVTGHIGGSFGMKNFYAETIMTIWASRKLKRPVKWENDREESLLSDYHGRDKVADLELALDADGIFLGIRANIIANMGAYLSPLFVAHTLLSNGGIIGVYKTPTAYLKISAIHTNTGSTNPYRGSNRPDVAYYMERLIDVAAAEINIDRMELRRRNIIPDDAFPYQGPLGINYDCGNFALDFEEALRLIDAEGFDARRARSEKNGKYRGLGLANNVEGAAGGGQEFVDIALDTDGKVDVFAGTTENGQGHPTMYRQVVSDKLAIDMDQIAVYEGDSDLMAQGNGTGGSRVSSVGASAAHAASEKIIEKAKAVAGHELEAAAADIEFADGRFQIAGTDRRLSWRDVAAAAHKEGLPETLQGGLSVNGDFQGTANNFPSGTHVCEVEVDKETGQVAIVRYVAVTDAGQVINPLLLEGQIHGGIGQGAGQVLMEGIQYDAKSGQMLTGSFLDYAMPRASDFCSFELIDHPTLTDTNPIGSKGAGEVGAACAMPVVVNAVVNALAGLGIKHIDMPMTGETVWTAMGGVQN